MEYTTPPSYGSTIVNVGGIAVDGKILFAGSGNNAEHVKVKADSQNDWAEPEDVKFVWNGKTKDGEIVSAIVEGPFGPRIDKIDVMEKVPGFIKTIVGGVAGTKPYIYQVRPLFNDKSMLQSSKDTIPIVHTTAKAFHQSHCRWQRDSRGRRIILGGDLHFLSESNKSNVSMDFFLCDSWPIHI